MLDPVLSKRDLTAILGRSRTTLGRWISSGKFPRPLSLVRGGVRITGWLLTSVKEWLNRTDAERRPEAVKALVRYRRGQIRADKEQRERAVAEQKRADEMPPCFDCHPSVFCHCRDAEQSCQAMRMWVETGRNDAADN